MNIARWLAIATAVFVAMAFVGTKRVLLSGGSPGFLPSCSAYFDYTNSMLQSQTFTTSPWTVLWSGVSAPTLTANAAVAPDGTTTAALFSLPSVSGSGHYAFLKQSWSASVILTNMPYTTDVYIKGAVGGETLWITSSPDGVNFQQQSVTATTTWQRYSLTWKGYNSPSNAIEIGVDLRNVAETATSAQTVYLWGAQNVQDRMEYPYLVTTTAAVAGSELLSCPANVKFRNFSSLVMYPGNPIVNYNTAAWNAGGVDGVQIRSGNKIGSTFYSALETDNGPGWNDIAIYAGSNPFTWAPAGSNPVLTAAPGTWKDNYTLHPSVINVSGGALAGPWYMYYSANSSTGLGSVGLATSPDFLTWTDYPSNPVILGGTAAAGLKNTGLPSVIQIGNTLYLYGVGAPTGSTNINVFLYTSPATDGVNWTFQGPALRFSTHDWASTLYGMSGYEDPFVFKNSHGYYEMVFTIVYYQSTHLLQQLGYAVSADGITWYTYQPGPLVTGTITEFPGDGSFYEDGNLFYLNYAWAINSGNSAIAYVQTMKDY